MQSDLVAKENIVKRNVLALGCFFLTLVVFLSVYSSPNANAAALLTATASSTSTSSKPTGTPTNTVVPTSTVTGSSSTDDLGALVRAALDKNRTLDSYGINFLMTTGILTPTQVLTPTVLLSYRAERNGEDTHVVTGAGVAQSLEFIKVGGQMFLRDEDAAGTEKWYVIPSDQQLRFPSESPMEFFPLLLGKSLQFSKLGSETLAGVSCEVYLQDRAAEPNRNTNLRPLAHRHSRADANPAPDDFRCASDSDRCGRRECVERDDKLGGRAVRYV